MSTTDVSRHPFNNEDTLLSTNAIRQPGTVFRRFIFPADKFTPQEA